MKCKQILPILLIFAAFSARAQNYALLPENFFLQKGEKINVHLILGEQFSKDEEVEYNAAETGKFEIFEDKKKTDLSKTKDGASPIISVDAANEGLVMVDMARKAQINEVEHDKFIKTLDDEGLSKLSDKAKGSNAETFRERSAWFMKTMVMVEKKGGNIYEKPQGDDLEIVLQSNPYKQNYGDDITAVINYKGKPAVDIPVTIYTRTVSGTLFPQHLTSDASGLIYFKLSREGIYYLHAIRMDLSKDHDADFDSLHATFTFAFSSENAMPNTYREFGFGNKH